MQRAGADRTPAALGLGILIGIFVLLLVALPLLELLGSPFGFLAAGLVAAGPTYALTSRRIGTGRAAGISAVVAVALAAGLFVAGFAAWVLGA